MALCMACLPTFEVYVCVFGCKHVNINMYVNMSIPALNTCCSGTGAVAKHGGSSTSPPGGLSAGNRRGRNANPDPMKQPTKRFQIIFHEFSGQGMTRVEGMNP